MTLNDLLPELLKLNREEMTQAIEILQQHIHQDMTSVKAVDSLEGATLEVWSPTISLDAARILQEVPTASKQPSAFTQRKQYPWLRHTKTRADKRNALLIYFASVLIGYGLLSFTATNFEPPGANVVFSMTVIFVTAFLLLGLFALLRTLAAIEAPESTASLKRHLTCLRNRLRLVINSKTMFHLLPELGKYNSFEIDCFFRVISANRRKHFQLRCGFSAVDC
jgi:hypothetical protein